jgi:hypothetical protein
LPVGRAGLLCYIGIKGGLIMKQIAAVETVLNNIGSTMSSIFSMKVEENGAYYFVSFYLDDLFYEAFVEKGSGIVIGLSFEPSAVSPLAQWRTVA